MALEDFSKKEKETLRFWKENRIFERSIKQRERAPNFIFYEGPPTANAKPGIHHILARVFKDIICRYKTMRGFKVERKAGWDTHGLPVEIEIEKKLKLKVKKDIEKYGIANFNQKCKESVWAYKQDWEKLTERIGFWIDIENPYITYRNDYIESLWQIIKQIQQKGLLYYDYKVVPYCPRCGTSLSSHEVAQGYKKIKEPAIYVKYQIRNPKSEILNKSQVQNSKFQKNKSSETETKIIPKTYLLVWTTTPWTLAANVAIAVNPRLTYAKIKTGSDFLILAKKRMKEAGIEGEIIEEFKGKDLVGLKYQPLYPASSIQHPASNIYKVVGADFVSLEEGTGLVHIAPAFGQEDLEVAKKNNLPVIVNVTQEGRFKKEVKPWQGRLVTDLGVNEEIIEDLNQRGLLFKRENYEHDYPFCWRCKTKLIYYAKKNWFVKTTAIKKNLLENNQQINWIPPHLKRGRFGEWLSEVKDWTISRERYWGTPLPIWWCQDDKNQKSSDNIVVIGSKEDLLKQKFSLSTYYILRHGQTIYQTKKKKMTYPPPEKERKKPVLLTKLGIVQIRKAAKDLKNKKIDLIYSSDLPRARQTAEIVAKEIGAKVIFDERLRDINLGIYHGGEKEKFYQDFPKKVETIYQKGPLKGESWAEVRKRMIDFLDEIDKKYQKKVILIISHGDPLWLLSGALQLIDDEKLIEIKIKKAGIKTGEWRKIEYKKIPLNREGRLDFHRPYIDELKFYHPKCAHLMERVPEVLDCWFDSGSMPFAQSHWPFTFAQNQKSRIKNQKLQPPKLFPADFISEAVDQTRGWFYTLLAVSTLLGFGAPYKNVISLGHVLDEKGEKMSKSKGNVVDPWKVIEKYGADATRWYFYTINQPGDPKLFTEKDVALSLKRFIMTFWNSYLFYKTYVADLHQYQLKLSLPKKRKNILDRWIISKLNQLILEVTDSLDKYDVTNAARALEKFIINDLSLWYIRRSRKRLQRPENQKEFNEASETLGFALLTLSKLTAPFIPFLSEQIYKDIAPGYERSVHLEDWPKANKEFIDKKLNQKMEEIRSLVGFVLSQRARFQIKVRQPLAALKIKDLRFEIKNDKELLDLIKEEINVKKIIFDKKIQKEVELDTKITPKLREEGIVREVIRFLQEMRKRAGFKPKDKILIRYFGTPELNRILIRNRTFILRKTRAVDFRLGKKPSRVFGIEREVEIDKQKLWLGIRVA